MLAICSHVTAQRACFAYEYQLNELRIDPSLVFKIESIEHFTQQFIKGNNAIVSRPDQTNVITIPVVVHILYHYTSEKISEIQVLKQLEILNRDYRRMNADSVTTPVVFR